MLCGYSCSYLFTCVKQWLQLEMCSFPLKSSSVLWGVWIRGCQTACDLCEATSVELTQRPCSPFRLSWCSCEGPAIGHTPADLFHRFQGGALCGRLWWLIWFELCQDVCGFAAGSIHSWLICSCWVLLLTGLNYCASTTNSSRCFTCREKQFSSFLRWVSI